jgi:glycosidase
MVSNHDSFAGARLFEQVAGDLAQYKLAAASYLLQGGPAFLYYGEEIGMAGAAGLDGDPRLRTPMSWTGNRSNAGFTSGTPFRELSANASSFNVEAQLADPSSLLAFYQTLLGLRRQLPALERGLAEDVAQAGLVLTFRRVLAGEQVAVAINYGTAAATATVTGLPANAQLMRAYPAGGPAATADGQGLLTVQLPAQSLAIFSAPPSLRDFSLR